MKRKLLVIGSMILLTQTALVAQTTPVKTSEEKKPDPASTWGIKFSGFIRNDAYYDSRQVVSARPGNQGHVLLYPLNVLKGEDGKDINATSSFGMLAIASRLSINVTGPDAFGAKTSGILEAEFFGNSNGNEDVFRLRHAYAKLDWPKTQLAFGQYWHPLFVTDCFPGTISFNTGMPFQPFARNPQIRLTQKLGKELNLILAATSQTETFVSAGSGTGIALGAASPSQLYLSDAVLPNLHAQLQYKTAKFLLGAALDYKQLKPALKVQSTPTAATYTATDEKVNGVTAEFYTKLTGKNLVVKAEAVYGQNLYDQIMMGGYLAYGAAPSITYKPIHVTAYWLDISGTGKKVIPGIFAGYSSNDGAKNTGAVASYARGIAANGSSLSNIWRIAPRAEFISGKFKFGTEIEVTGAAYGTALSDAKVSGATTNVTNTRLLFTTTLSF